MRYLILAMWLAIAQTPTPVPGKAPDSANGAGQSVTKNTGDYKAPTLHPPSVVKPDTGNSEQSTSNAPKSKNEERAIRIRELPPVSVSRDWADWILWVFDGLLVAVGFFGIRLAYKTLKTVDRQTKATENAANAAQASADAMINSERAWVVAGVKRYQNTATAFSLSVTNHGRTPARILWYERQFSQIPSTGTQLSDATNRATRQVNRQVFLAVGKPRRLEIFDIPKELGMKVWDDIRAGNITLACSGQIHYLDVVSGRFRDTWFCYSYSVSRHVFSADDLPPEENRYT
jgi:hypothetical protein